MGSTGTTSLHCLRACLSLLIACLCSLANQTLAQTFASRDLQRRDSVELANLRQIEQTVLPPTIAVGPPAHQEIVDYYCAANAGLSDHFRRAREVYAAGDQWPYRAMTVVAGSAGIGKTFIKSKVYADIPSEQIWKLDIRELFEHFAEQELAELKPDLQYGDRVYNRLLSLTQAGRKSFEALVQSRSAAFVVVDSLDEIHPDDYAFVLERLERLALGVNHGFMHLVVFGRPTAFQAFLHGHRQAATRPGIHSYVLNKPDFRTTGDLVVSNWNFDCWKYGLCRAHLDGSRPMPLDDYQRWCRQGYSVAGDFKDVVFEKNVQMTPAARNELQRWSMDYPVVATVQSNLAANGMVRELLSDCLRRGESYDERRFMNAFLTQWLERDQRSSDRPSRLKPEHLDSYLQWLESVAVKYAAAGQLDEQGYFDVGEADRVVIEEQGTLASLPVRAILDRSGLVTVDPRQPYDHRYRFEPFWFHRLLVQMHHERRDRALTGTTAATQLAEAARTGH